MKKCPVCELLAEKQDPISAFTLGLGMATVFDLDTVLSICCDPHQSKMLEAMTIQTKIMHAERTGRAGSA